MSEINNGGHAFPVLQYTQNGYVVLASGGMTLRDYFAGKAMQGIAASFDPDHSNHLVPQNAAIEAYEIADAMIKARSQS